MFRFIVVCGICCLFCFEVLADRDVGNGGDVVVCYNKKQEIVRIELLDFYEARTLRSIQYDLGGANLSVDEKLEIALNRLRPLAPRTAQRFSERLKTFISETNWVRGVNLVDVPDSEHELVESGCQIEQIAVQRPVRVPEDRFYTINADLWDRLDNDNRAGLMLHEILYSELSSTQRNSRSTRYLNSYLSSTRLDLFTVSDFFKLSEKVGFPKLEYGTLDLQHLSRKPDGSIANAWVEGGTYILGLAELKVERSNTDFYANGQPIKLRFTASTSIPISPTLRIEFGEMEVDFREDGSIAQLGGRDIKLFTPNAQLSSSGSSNWSTYTFTSGMELSSCDGCGGSVRIQSKWVLIREGKYEFWPNGIIKSFKPAEKIVLQVQGQSREFGYDFLLEFYADEEMMAHSASSSAYYEFEYQVGAQKLKLLHPVRFHPQSQVKQAFLARAATIPTASGGKVFFPAGVQLEFDINGAATNWQY